MSWQWLVALLATTAVNLATFAPPWMVALPGLRFWRAIELTQASTALAIVFPGGAAVGAAGSYGILRKWGFPPAGVSRAGALTGPLEQVLNPPYPSVPGFLLTGPH